MSQGQNSSNTAKTTAIAFAVVLGGLAGVKVSWQVRHTAATEGIEQVPDRMFDDVLHHPFTPRGDQVDWIAGAAVVAVLLLVWVWRWSEALDRRVGAEHGSAKWAKAKELTPLASPKKEQNILLTKHIKLSTDPLNTKPEFQRNTNIIAVGGSGSGKTRRFILPNIAATSASLIITDPKAELYNAVGGYLERNGWRVRQLNLIDLAASDGFNPLAYLRPGREPEDIEQLAKAIIANTQSAKPTGNIDPFWDRAENALLTSLLAYVVAAYPADRQNLPEVAQLLSHVSTAGRQRADGGTDAMFSEASRALTAGAVGAATDILTYATRQYAVFKSAHVKTADSILLCAGVRLSLLSIPAVEKVMSTDALGLDRMGEEKTAVFVVLPDTTEAFSFVTALFFQTFFQTAFRQADARDDGRLPIPVQCWLDEFPNIGIIPEFAQRMATMRSRNISAEIIVQNIGQVKARYGDDHETIIGNCDTILFLGTNDKATAKDISERLGRETITSVDTSEQRGMRGGSSRSRRSLGRDLMTADEVLRMPRSDALVMISGMHPVRDDKLPFPQLTDRSTAADSTPKKQRKPRRWRRRRRTTTDDTATSSNETGMTWR